MPLTQVFAELIANRCVAIQSNQVREFHKAASAHNLKYEIGPHICGKTVLITI